jgi:HprK-related kinase B
VIEVTALETAVPEVNLDWISKALEPGKSRIKEEYYDFPDGRLVRKRLTGVVFAMTDTANLAFGPCLVNSNQVVNFINNRCIEWQLRRGGVLAHAAGVELNGKGLALAGLSGMGKSTLALQLTGRGCRFVSNDRLVIRKADTNDELVMHGIAKHPRVNPGTVLNNDELRDLMPAEKRRMLSSLSPSELWELEQKYDVIIHRIYGGDRFVLRSPLNAVVLLNWNRKSADLQIRRVNFEQRPELLAAIVKQPGLFFRSLSEDEDVFHESDYAKYLERIAIYEFHGGLDFAAASDACMEILKGKFPD